MSDNVNNNINDNTVEQNLFNGDEIDGETYANILNIYTIHYNRDNPKCSFVTGVNAHNPADTNRIMESFYKLIIESKELSENETDFSVYTYELANTSNISYKYILTINNEHYVSMSKLSLYAYIASNYKIGESNQIIIESHIKSI